MIERGQHDDHCWLTAGGRAWCIRRIARTPTGWRFDLWRGYEPHIEHATLTMPAGWDVKGYAETAASWLRHPYVEDTLRLRSFDGRA